MFDTNTFCAFPIEHVGLYDQMQKRGIRMSFHFNSCQQMSIWDSMRNLTSREQRFLQQSWAVPFAERVFPAIDEDPYAVLFSEKDSRPNTPVNVIIGALLLKEMNGRTRY